MAWTEQSWRYSLAGIPDPSQGLTEQSTAFGLTNVPAASYLEDEAPQLWDYDETLTLAFTPLPTGFDVTTRYAMAGVPAVNLSDSIDRDGSVTSTISTFSVDFDGTRTIVGLDGDISATMSDFSASFTGEYTTRLYFDIEYSVTPSFTFAFLPARS